MTRSETGESRLAGVTTAMLTPASQRLNSPDNFASAGLRLPRSLPFLLRTLRPFLPQNLLPLRGVRMARSALRCSTASVVASHSALRAAFAALFPQFLEGDHHVELGEHFVQSRDMALVDALGAPAKRWTGDALRYLDFFGEKNSASMETGDTPAVCFFLCIPKIGLHVGWVSLDRILG